MNGLLLNAGMSRTTAGLKYRSQVTGYRSQVTGYRSQVTIKNTCEFAVSSYLVCILYSSLQTRRCPISLRFLLV